MGAKRNESHSSGPFTLRAIAIGIDLRPYAGPSQKTLVRCIRGPLGDQVLKTVTATRRFLRSQNIACRSLRLCVSPIGSFNGSWRSGYLDIALALDELAEKANVDFIGGFSAFLTLCLGEAQKGFLMEFPECLARTKRVCGFLEIARSDNGIHFDALKLATHALRQMSVIPTRTEPATRFSIVCNSAQGTPYMPMSYHSSENGDVSAYVGIGGVRALNAALSSLSQDAELDEVVRTISEVVHARMRQAHELIGKMTSVLKLGACSIDSSLAPLPFAREHSLLELLRKIGVPSLNSPGSLAALALLNDAVKRGSVASGSKYLSGLSGSFLSVSEDCEIYHWLKNNILSLDRMLALTSVCSVGLDMIALPNSIKDEVLMGIIADEMSLGILHHKTTSARLILTDHLAGQEIVFRTNPIFGRSFVLPPPAPDQFGLVKRGGFMPRHWRDYRN